LQYVDWKWFDNIIDNLLNNMKLKWGRKWMGKFKEAKRKKNKMISVEFYIFD
jgi:hypothetical protein